MSELTANLLVLFLVVRSIWRQLVEILLMAGLALSITAGIGFFLWLARVMGAA